MLIAVLLCLLYAFVPGSPNFEAQSNQGEGTHNSIDKDHKPEELGHSNMRGVQESKAFLVVLEKPVLCSSVSCIVALTS